MNDIHYLTGESPDITLTAPLPLEEYYPRYPTGVIRAWLEENAGREGLVLDPFGSSPRLLLEAARGSYRVLAAVNNPITRFLIHRFAQPPSREDLNAAAAALAAAYKGKERLEPHLLSLYETECPHCRARTSARAFLWSKNKAMPIRKRIACASCGDRGEYPTNQEDVEKALSYQEQSLYHARALTRVAPPQNPIRTQVEKALQIYPPRAVYALFTLVNKYIGMSLEQPRQQALTCLLLSAFALSHGLQPDQTEGKLGRKLTLPGRYLENNVWLAFEEAVKAWQLDHNPLPLSRWPDLPPDAGGICLYPGRFRELGSQLSRVDLSTSLLLPPRPHPLMWALSALWTGWLWGQEAAADFHGLLSLNKTDWVWYSRALENNFSSLNTSLNPGTISFNLLVHVDQNFLSTIVTAAQSAGLSLSGLALNPGTKQAQLLWNKPAGELTPAEDNGKDVLRNAGYQHLQQRGEPAHSLTLFGAGLLGLARSRWFPSSARKPVQETYQQLQDLLEETYAYRQGFLYYPESQRWWHQELELSPRPLSDRVEQEAVELLIEAEGPVSAGQLVKSLYRQFPGLQTPDAAMIEVCLASYSEPLDERGERIQLREGDRPERRHQDLEEMAALLDQLGQQLAFDVRRLAPSGGVQIFRWIDGDDDEHPLTFFLSASALLGKLIVNNPRASSRNWIVLPGSRAQLVTHKLQHSPPLVSQIEKHWGFLKFRHLRRLTDEGNLTRENFLERFALDPLTYDDPQLPLI